MINPKLDTMVSWVYADSKEEVFLTKDVGGGMKIWNLVDGKLLFDFKKGDASALGKILRYSIQDDEFLRKNLDLRLSFDGPISIYHFYYDKEFFKGFSVPTNGKTAAARHQKTKQVTYMTYKNGATYYYGVDAPDDATTCQSCDFVQLAKIKNDGKQYESLNFSTSGKYIYSLSPTSNAVCMIDVAEKNLLWKDKDWKLRKSVSYSFVFNKAETQCATATKNGMLVLDVVSGKLLDSISLPERFKQFENGMIFPCSDMKSFVFIKYCNKFDTDFTKCSSKVWLVRKDEAIELGEQL